MLLLTASAGCTGLLGSEAGPGGPDADVTTTPADANGPAPGSSGFDAAATERGHFETLSNSSFTTSLSTGEPVQASGDTLSLSVSQVGDTTVAEPDWLPDA